jgi:hypothetical protein
MVPGSWFLVHGSWFLVKKVPCDSTRHQALVIQPSPHWTAPCLRSPIHRGCLLINVCLVKQWPFSPSGEKVADRPDDGAFAGGRGPKRAPHPSPLPQFFGSILPSNNSLSAKNWGRGGNMALSNQAPCDSTKHLLFQTAFLTKHQAPSTAKRPMPTELEKQWMAAWRRAGPELERTAMRNSGDSVTQPRH